MAAAFPPMLCPIKTASDNPYNNAMNKRKRNASMIPGLFLLTCEIADVYRTHIRLFLGFHAGFGVPTGDLAVFLFQAIGGTIFS